LGGAVGGGLFGLLGIQRSVNRADAAAQTCVLSLISTVRLGPDAGLVLQKESKIPGQLQGKRSFTLTSTSAIDAATLLLSDGNTKMPVVGQAVGRGLEPRIATGDNKPLILVGVAQQDLLLCRGPIDGQATGPQPGDLGDWHGTLAQLPGSGSSSGGSSNVGSVATNTPSSSSANPTLVPATSQPTSTPTNTPTNTPTQGPTATTGPCAKTGEECSNATCCLGYCNQSNQCDCQPNGQDCVPVGTGGCCDGNPCNALSLCGPIPCAKTGEDCTNATCCLGYCNQSNQCDCQPNGQDCLPTGTGACCDGNPCNSAGNCGP
jgi:hypothetical protein